MSRFILIPSLHLLFTVILSFTSIYSFAQFEFRNYTKTGFIWAIERDGNILSIANQGGVIEFDVVSKQQQKMQAWNSDLRGTGVYDIMIDENGIKWVGTENAGLLRISANVAEQYYVINSTTTLYSVNAILPDTKGGVFFTARTGSTGGLSALRLFHFDGDQFVDLTSDLQLSNDFYGFHSTTMSIDDYGKIYIVDNEKIKVHNGLSLEQQITGIDLDLGAAIFQKLIIDAENNLWVNYTNLGQNNIAKISTQDKEIFEIAADQTTIQLMLDETGNLWHHSRDYEQKKFYFEKYENGAWDTISSSDLPTSPNESRYPNLHYIDENGNFYASMFVNDLGNRLHKINESTWEVIAVSLDNFRNQSINKTVKDCAGNVILQSTSGFSIYNGSDFQDYSLLDYNIEGHITDMVYDQNNCWLWLSVSAGFSDPDLFKFDGSDFIANQSPTPGFGLNRIAIDEHGGIYGCSHTEQIYYFIDNEWSEIMNPNSKKIARISYDKEQNIWGSYSGTNGFFHYDGTSWTDYDSQNYSISKGGYWFLFEAPNKVWTSSNAGLHLIESSSLSTIAAPTNSGNPIDISGMLQDSIGNYWISSYTHGLTKWNDLETVNINVTNSNIGSNSLVDISIINDNIFLSHWSNGFTIVANDPFSAIVNIEESQRINTFPNPSDGHINFDFKEIDSTTKPILLKVYNSIGILKSELELSQPEADLSHLGNGTYFLSIERDGKIFHSKLVLVK